MVTYSARRAKTNDEFVLGGKKFQIIAGLIRMGNGRISLNETGNNWTNSATQ